MENDRHMRHLDRCELAKQLANSTGSRAWVERMEFDLWNFLGGLLTGALGGALVTLQLTKNVRADRNGTATDQSGARAGGDIVGRDKR